MDGCPKKGRLIGGCRYEPRYHVEEPCEELRSIISKQWQTTQADRDLLVRRVTYVGDVCVRCGRTVNAGGS